MCTHSVSSKHACVYLQILTSTELRKQWKEPWLIRRERWGPWKTALGEIEGLKGEPVGVGPSEWRSANWSTSPVEAASFFLSQRLPSPMPPRPPQCPWSFALESTFHFFLSKHQLHPRGKIHGSRELMLAFLWIAQCYWVLARSYFSHLYFEHLVLAKHFTRL